MKALYPKQAEAVSFFLDALKARRNTIDTSSVGTGKTVVAAHLAKQLGKPVAVICPKSVIPSWERELEETGLKPLFVLNYEKLRTGRTKHMSKKGKKMMRWHLPKSTLVLVDEIHKCKGHYTQSAQLVISLVEQGFRVHGMSATACEDPTEMRAIGFMLGLHGLNKRADGRPSWFSWMQSNGCRQDQWKQWRLMSRAKLQGVKEAIYGNTGHKLTVEDFPDSFRANRVFIEPTQFSNTSKIIKAYDELGLTPAIIESYILDSKSITDSGFVIVDILRARQLAESFKLPDLAEIAQDLVSQGNSVVLFVNFTDSVNALCEQLKCGKIDGNQTATERQKVIDDFQADRTHIVVANIAAGGTGVSLHDTHGNRPRVSLISPSFSAKNHLQTLGRIHRNGAKSDAIQKVLVAADSIEEKVMETINKKLKNLEALHGLS
tara:strand:- start:261 stop:1562 length:1302 start_codon:yes stop_codon:yes gene_type:complete